MTGTGWENISSLTTDNGSNMRTLLASINAAIENGVTVEENDENVSDGIGNPQEHSACNIPANSGNHHWCDLEIANVLNEIEETDQNQISMLMNQILPNEADWSFINITNDIELPASSAMPFLLVNGVNCAAHTLQLVVRDSLANLGSQHANTIKLCREVCKFIRLQTTIYEMEKRNIKKNSRPWMLIPDGVQPI